MSAAYYYITMQTSFFYWFLLINNLLSPFVFYRTKQIQKLKKKVWNISLEFVWLNHLETFLNAFQHKCIVFPEMSTEPLKEEIIAKLIAYSSTQIKMMQQFSSPEKKFRATYNKYLIEVTTTWCQRSKGNLPN